MLRRPVRTTIGEADKDKGSGWSLEEGRESE